MMKTKRSVCLSTAASLGVFAAAAWLAGCTPRGAADRTPAPESARKGDRPMSEEIVKSDEEWRAALTPEQYRVTRRKGTEPAFSGEYNTFKKTGVFNCAGCGVALFRSDAKYDSGSGWPSFWQTADDIGVATVKDTSLLPARTEVLCARCGAHLGHVFDDGPQPTGLRYCVNSVALKFAETAGAEE